MGFGHAPADHPSPCKAGSLGLKDSQGRSAEGLAGPSRAALIALPFLEGKTPINFSGSRIGPRAQACSGFPSPYSPLTVGLTCAGASSAAGMRGATPRGTGSKGGGSPGSSTQHCAAPHSSILHRGHLWPSADRATILCSALAALNTIHVL